MKKSSRPLKKAAPSGSWQTPEAPQFGSTPPLARSSSMGNLATLFGGAARESSFFPTSNEMGWSFVGDWGQPPESEPTKPVLASDLFAAALNNKNKSKSNSNNSTFSNDMYSSNTSTTVSTTKIIHSEYPHKSAYKKTISCPDFSVFTAEAQDVVNQIGGDDEITSSSSSSSTFENSAELKRDRRLARNRASARLRRQRKRSTIETLEHKIENLNIRIEKLQSYCFGSGLERGSGLSIDVGTRNQPMSQPDEPTRIEQSKYFLDNMCRDVKILLNNQVFAALMKSVTGPDESTSERRALQQELRNLLNLTKEQDQILSQDVGLSCDVAHQYTTICALLQCTMVGIQNQWFDSILHDRVRHAFLDSVTEEQNKRYMNWADRNTNAISLLSCYRPTDQDKAQAEPVEKSFWRPVGARKGKPVFYFGGKGSGKFFLFLFCMFVLYVVGCFVR